MKEQNGCERFALSNNAKEKKLKQMLNLFLMKNTPRNLQAQPPEMFCKKVVLKNFANFTGKHLHQRPFFNKVAG